MGTNGKPIDGLWAPLAGAALVLVLVPLFLGAGGDAPTGRRARIERMTQSERDRLRANFALYKTLPESRRRELRRLHEKVESDPDLKRTLIEFHQWYRSLDPWQKEKLKDERDPVKRLKVVKEFQKQQDEEDEERQRRNRFMEFTRERPRISPEEWSAVMQLIEESANIPPADRSELNQMNEFVRHVTVFEAAVQQARDRRDRWPNEDLKQKIRNVVDETKPPWAGAFADGRGPDRRITIGTLIAVELFVRRMELAREMDPSQEELDAFFINLDTKARDEIMKQRPDFANRNLRKKYFAAHLGDFDRVSDLMRRFWWRSRFRGGRRGDDDRGRRGPRDR